MVSFTKTDRAGREGWRLDAQGSLGHVKIETPAGGIWVVHGIWVVARRSYGLHSACQACGAIERSVDVCISVPLFQIIFLS